MTTVTTMTIITTTLIINISDRNTTTAIISTNNNSNNNQTTNDNNKQHYCCQSVVNCFLCCFGSSAIQAKIVWRFEAKRDQLMLQDSILFWNLDRNHDISDQHMDAYGGPKQLESSCWKGCVFTSQVPEWEIKNLIAKISHKYRMLPSLASCFKNSDYGQLRA